MLAATFMLPDFMIIGTMKAGTSSLFRYLASHPEIVPSSVKETDFFFSESNYKRGRAWYEGLFEGDGTHGLEASPNYTKRHIKDGIPERIHALMPELKMIFVARDPIERLISHYVHNIDHGRERRAFSEAIKAPDSNYVLTSRYHYQLEAFLQHYPQDQLLVLESERLRDDTTSAVGAACAFFGISPDCDPEVMRRKIHQSSAKTAASLLERTLLKATSHAGATHFIKRHTLRFRKPIERPHPTNEDLDRLRDVLADDIEKLRALTGLAFSNWSI